MQRERIRPLCSADGTNTRQRRTMDLIRVIYSSRPFGFDQAVLNGILVHARRSNALNGITGALICRADLYLQLLEGPPDAVGSCYGRIVKDDRGATPPRPASRSRA
jgi:hypothetical protein